MNQEVSGILSSFFKNFFFVWGLLLVYACEDPSRNYGNLGEQERRQVRSFYNDPIVDDYRQKTGHSLDGYEASRMINGLVNPPSNGYCPPSDTRSARRSAAREPANLPPFSTRVYSQLPGIGVGNSAAARAKGYYTYLDDKKRWGTERTKWRLLKAGEKLAEKGMVMGVGNISQEGGGITEPHKSHRRGTDVDFRLLGPSGKASPSCTVSKPSCFDRQKTFEMVKTLIDVDVRNVKSILINDKELRDMINEHYKDVTGNVNADDIAKHYTGHEDHIHFSWKN